MISVTHKGFKIKYERDQWICCMRLPGVGETYVTKDQLSEVKFIIDEALSMTTFKEVEVIKTSFDDMFRFPSSFHRLYEKRKIRPKNYFAGGTRRLYSDSLGYIDKSVFIANDHNLGVFKELGVLKGEIEKLTDKARELFETLQPLEEKHLEVDDETIEAKIKKAKKSMPLSVSDKTQMVDRLHKESKMERVYCTSALKDTKWNYKLAVEKLILLKKEKKL